MVWIGGADGCKGGWFRALLHRETGELHFDLVKRAADLLNRPPQPVLLGLDIPIGLPMAGPRDCDRMARKCLGWPRRCSVFPAPIRPALAAGCREQASRLTQRVDGRGVGAHAWALYDKIREVDELLSLSPEARQRIREVHPEICFWAWNQAVPMAAKKKSDAGKRERLRLATEWLGGSVMGCARGDRLRRDVADDDVLDAIAALWTADRLLRGVARTLPDAPPVDSAGLRMEIVF